jgi:hypothetical protein
VADDKQFVEARRLETLGSKYSSSNLNDNAKSILLDQRLEDNSTNRSYKPGQQMFIKLALGFTYLFYCRGSNQFPE